jgi:hypothetical protein
VIENRYYRITLDPAGGGIQSIQDKELGWELVDRSSPFLFGAYVYTAGADNLPRNSLYRYGAAQPVPELHPQAAGRGRVVSVVQSAGSVQAVLEASAPHSPRVQMEITLPEDAKRIDFRYSIHKDAVLSKEAVYIAFPFAADKPEFTYDTQNGWVNPGRDELAGGSREWYAVSHWAAMNDRGQGRGAALVPYDAPMVNFGDIVRGNWPTEFRPRSATIFSWLMSNYWGTNFPSSQGGDFSFRYSVAHASRMGTDDSSGSEPDGCWHGTGHAGCQLRESAASRQPGRGRNGMEACGRRRRQHCASGRNLRQGGGGSHHQ